MIQEYYQEHGVRPGSKIEADLLDVENRRKENEQRQAAFDKQREEERYRQFIEESRRMGKQVSEELRREEVFRNHWFSRRKPNDRRRKLWCNINNALTTN